MLLLYEIDVKEKRATQVVYCVHYGTCSVADTLTNIYAARAATARSPPRGEADKTVNSFSSFPQSRTLIEQRILSYLQDVVFVAE